jgi:hypothetical protein
MLILAEPDRVAGAVQDSCCYPERGNISGFYDESWVRYDDMWGYDIIADLI